MGSNGQGRGWIGSAVLLVLAAALLLRPWEELRAPGGDPPPAASALVTRVIDGDTIEVRLGGRREDVRLIGVDTPETVDPEAPVQCFGRAASRFTRRALDGRRVRLVFGAERRDAYSRLLAYVHLGGRFVNAELVHRGLGRSLVIAPNDRHAGRLKRLEIAASRAGRGLWGGCGT